MDLLLLDYYYNYPGITQNEHSYVRYEITLYLLLLLYSGPTVDWFNLKKCSQSQQKKNIGRTKVNSELLAPVSLVFTINMYAYVHKRTC